MRRRASRHVIRLDLQALPRAPSEDVRPVVGRDPLRHQPVEDLRVRRGQRVGEQAHVDGDEGLGEEDVEVGRLVVLLTVEEGAEAGDAGPLAGVGGDLGHGLVVGHLAAAGGGDEGGVLVDHGEAGEGLQDGARGAVD